MNVIAVPNDFLGLKARLGLVTVAPLFCLYLFHEFIFWKFDYWYGRETILPRIEPTLSVLIGMVALVCVVGFKPWYRILPCLLVATISTLFQQPLYNGLCHISSLLAYAYAFLGIPFLTYLVLVKPKLGVFCLPVITPSVAAFLDFYFYSGLGSKGF